MSRGLTFAEAAQSKREHKKWVARAFDATPASYGSGGDFHERFALRLVAHAGLRPGQTILDVATGTAPAAIAAASTVGSNGHVVGVDLSTGILRSAAERLKAVGLPGISLCQGDAEQLPFADERFDVVLCSSSMAWLPDIPSTLVEWHRVLRKGGQLSFSCFARAAQPMGRIVRTHLTRFGISLPDLNAPLDTQDKCRHLLERACYAVRDIVVEQWGDYVNDIEKAFDGAWNGLRSRFDLELHEPQLSELKHACLHDARDKMDERGFLNDATVFFVSATKLI
jgi:ubiquinone/menaquinone biosynthesis C-methylase UbiE